MLAAEDGLTDDAAGLIAATPSLTRILRNAIRVIAAAAATDLDALLPRKTTLGREAGMGKTGIDVPVPFADGRPAFAHVLPIGASQVRGALSPNATAAVFLTSAGSAAKLPLEALSATFGFTPTEAKIIEKLVAGETISAAGAALGIAPTTARTHLARIMDKAGTERQADLIRLVTGLAAPVRREGG